MVDAKGLSRRRASRQRQFLDVAGVSEAAEKFRSCIRMEPLGTETLALADVLNRVISDDVAAAVDVPAFDRTNVDGFAVRAADTAGAGEDVPRILALNDEVITPGVVPRVAVAAGGRRRGDGGTHGHR
jgi:putative molybdopterin biosynthesis protein